MNTKQFIISEKQMELDMKLAPYDLWATKVHVLMLVKQNLVPLSSGQEIVQALESEEKEYKNGNFHIDQVKGLHLTIEKKVVEKIGEDGYFMHTARSRNDQVATAELLYLKQKVLNLFYQLLQLLKLLIYLSSQHLTTIMPGYTHMQPAKPTTFAQWSLAYFDMFTRDIDVLRYKSIYYDRCPLGAVESYGTSWKIDRKYTAKLLGFEKVWEIPQDAISSRGMFQLACLGVLKDIGLTLSKMASDLILFNTFEFGYISLGEEIAKQMDAVTGSSIMPQKKNPDVLELIRAISYQLIGYENIVANILAGLPMGYNRDSREVKEYIELSFEKSTNSLLLLSKTLKNLKVKKDKMLQAVQKNYSMATNLADYIAQKTKLPYRRVYQVIGFLVSKKIKKGQPLASISLKELVKVAKLKGLNVDISLSQLKEALDPVKAISRQTHVGGANAKIMKKMIQKRKKLLEKKEKWLNTRRNDLKKAVFLTKKEVDILEAKT